METTGRIIFESKGIYKVKNQNGEFFAKITGKQIFKAKTREDYPAVGDWVVIDELNKEQAVIKNVLPRPTVIKRKFGDKNKKGEKKEVQIIATNIDVAFIVESMDRDFNLNRFERYFAIVQSGGVKPAIILNKTDLVSERELNEKIEQIKNRFPDVDFLETSTISDKGLDKLQDYIKKEKTYCFLGSSGVGKSSLINKLLEKNSIKVREISLHSGRGKHTTTARQMYFLENGGIVIDNPGMREVGLVDSGEEADLFDEIKILGKECKYINCTHIHEPDCKVLEALNAGKLDPGKYANYVNLKKETKYYELDNFEKRKKDRQFGKFLKNAKKDLKKFNFE